MKAIFVTGIDTDVGKTIVSGGLLRMIEGSGKTAYWKPVQTGTLISEDRRDLKALTGLHDERFLPSSYVFPDPVSPHLAAERWHKTISAEVLTEAYRAHLAVHDRLVVEGAGGLLVPLSGDLLLADWVRSLDIPCLLVVEDRLGAINHTLLTLEAMQRRNLPCPGFVLTKATGRWGNKEAIERHGGAKCLAEIPLHQDGRTLISLVAADGGLRRLMGLAEVPL
jgi:dethiobiotin synthetase